MSEGGGRCQVEIFRLRYTVVLRLTTGGGVARRCGSGGSLDPVSRSMGEFEAFTQIYSLGQTVGHIALQVQQSLRACSRAGAPEYVPRVNYRSKVPLCQTFPAGLTTLSAGMVYK